jgi:hypothetical protein
MLTILSNVIKLNEMVVLSTRTKKWKNGLLVALLCLMVNLVFTQTELRYRDRVWLQNGSTMVGELVDIQDEIVKLKLRSGNVILINRSEIKRFAQYLPNPAHDSYGNLYFQDREHKHIYAIDFGLGFWAGFGMHRVRSLEISGSYKYRLSQKHLAGIRLNLKAVEIGRYDGVPALDFHFEYAYLLGKTRKINPYVSARAGFGMALHHADEFRKINNSIPRPGGGLGFGLIKSVGHHSAFFTEIGLNLQQYSYRYSTLYNNDASTQRSEFLNHLIVRIGYLF